MDNLEKRVRYGTQDEDKQYIDTTQHVFDTTIRKQTQRHLASVSNGILYFFLYHDNDFLYIVLRW